jgi:hypothetical protein
LHHTELLSRSVLGLTVLVLVHPTGAEPTTTPDSAAAGEEWRAVKQDYEQRIQVLEERMQMEVWW